MVRLHEEQREEKDQDNSAMIEDIHKNVVFDIHDCMAFSLSLSLFLSPYPLYCT